MSVIDKASAHFLGLKGSVIEVPEWGEPEGVDGEGNAVPAKPLRIAYDPPSLMDLRVFNEKAKGNEMLAMCYMIARISKDEAGQPLFTDADATKLYQAVDPQVLSRIGAQMQLRMSVGEARKN